MPSSPYEGSSADGTFLSFSSPPTVRPSNRLLAGLPTEDYERLKADLEAFPLVRGRILYDVGDPMPHVYFPDLGVISMVTMMHDGHGVEAASIGNEGVAGLSVFYGDQLASSRWVVASSLLSRLSSS